MTAHYANVTDNAHSATLWGQMGTRMQVVGNDTYVVYTEYGQRPPDPTLYNLPIGKIAKTTDGIYWFPVTESASPVSIQPPHLLKTGAGNLVSLYSRPGGQGLFSQEVGLNPFSVGAEQMGLAPPNSISYFG